MTVSKSFPQTAAGGASGIAVKEWKTLDKRIKNYND